MADKSAFTSEEWGQILASPMLAGMAVTLAEPSGIFGTLKEGLVGARALLEARKEAAGNTLAKAIATEFDTSDGRSAARETIKAEMTAKTPAELKAQALAALGKVNAIIAAKAPEDAPAFRLWLKDIARKAAEASSEGGFLGFGGVQVSEAEKATLTEIDSVLA